MVCSQAAATDAMTTSTTTYAEATQKSTKPTSTRSLPTNSSSFEELRKRTFIFYNLNTPTNITTTVIKSLIDKFNIPADQLIQKIYKDTRFNSRYVVCFKNLYHFETLLKEGITINGTKIKGKTEKPSRYYLPKFPGYCSQAEVKEALAEKGIENIVYIKQRISKEFGIPVGGFFIGISNLNINHFFLNFEGDSYKATRIERSHVEPEQHVLNDKSTDPKPDDVTDQSKAPRVTDDDLDANMDSDEDCGGKSTTSTITSTTENTPKVETTSKFTYNLDPSFVIGYISTDEEVPNGKGKKKRKKKPVTIETESFLSREQRRKINRDFHKKIRKSKKKQKAQQS